MMAHFINVPQEIGIFAEDGGLVGRYSSLLFEVALLFCLLLYELFPILSFNARVLLAGAVPGLKVW
jgi:hypothetical protein